MTTCAACGAENAASRKFCGACGTALARSCPACGAANEADTRFCGECGSPLDEAAAALARPRAAAAPAAAERRLVSVLFVDLVGFTSISEQRDAEEVRELLSRYFEQARTLIVRYGGTIEKFIGDAVMAVWGTPVAREDDAERAVRAGFELLDAVTELGDQVGAEIRLRGGIATGEAAVTLGAEGQGMVAGDLVNTAARIQSEADAGSILVNDATRRATSAAIAYEDAGERQLKGKTEPVPVWRALQVTASRGGAIRASGLEPPFVGRQREFRVLKELFHESAEASVSRLVTVVGIAGIGKSRLAWEFEKYLDGLADDVWWHRGRCLAYGDGVAHWALAEMVRMRARIVEEEPAEEALAKLNAMLAETIADETERAWIGGRLAHLLALADGESFERQDLFSAWRLFFERLSDRAPVVLVFEDLQWADASLLDFIEHLLDWSRTHPIYVVALARPEIAERHTGFGSSGGSTTLSLDPLPEPAMRELMSSFVPGLPGELTERILARAQGVPLYAVETVRMLLDRGALAPDGERFAVIGSLDSLDVPETLHALVAARIDDLKPDERAVVQDASVLGKSFTTAGLTALSGRDPAELELLLISLMRKEIFSVQADPRSPERGQYAFLQDLLQRVAYETMSRADRRSRHLAAATHLEGVLDAEAADVIAAHYLDAYNAAPDAEDADLIRSKAGEMLVRAGRRAASLGASEEADRALVQAAELLDDPALRAELLAEAGDAMFGGGRWAEARDRFERSIALYDEAGQPLRSARAAGQLGWTMWLAGDLTGGAARIEKALAVLADEQPDADLAALIEFHARLRFFLGDHDVAGERIERALEIAEALVAHDVLIDALNTKHLVLSSHNRVEEGMALLERAIAIGRARPPGRSLARALYNLSYQLAGRDRFADALEIDREMLELARRRGERVEEQMALGHMATSLFELGRWDEAYELASGFDPGASARAPGDRSVIPWLLAQRGDIEEARREFELILPHFDDSERQMLTYRLYIDSVLLLAEGRAADALATSRRSLGIARDDFTLLHPLTKWNLVSALEAAFELGDREVIVELLVTTDEAPPVHRTPLVEAIAAHYGGRLLALDGDLDGAERLLRAAAGHYGEIDASFERARALLRLGEVLAASRPDDAAVPLEEARQIFASLGARPWLARVDAVGTTVLA